MIFARTTVIQRTLTSTALNCFPLYTPTTLPIISGTMIILRKCVFTVEGFSLGAAAFFWENYENLAHRNTSPMQTIKKQIKKKKSTYSSPEFLEEGHRLPLQTTVRESSASASMD